MTEVVHIMLSGDRASAFRRAVEAFPGLNCNMAGQVAALLFVEVQEQEPTRMADLIRRVQAGRAKKRAARQIENGGAR